jgi:methylmalonyl-CoA mutase
VVRDALAALQRAARDGAGNLLERTIDCIRARATVGECTQALETVWPRHVVQLSICSGAPGPTLEADPAWRDACDAVARLSLSLGRRPRILLAKLGQDGHDRGARVVAATLADAGFDVIAGELFATPAQVCLQAAQNEVDVIGVSSLAGAHRELVLLLLAELRNRNIAIPVVVGGNIDRDDRAVLKARGVVECFATGAALADIVTALAAICSDCVLPFATRMDASATV